MTAWWQEWGGKSCFMTPSTTNWKAYDLTESYRGNWTRRTRKASRRLQEVANDTTPILNLTVDTTQSSSSSMVKPPCGILKIASVQFELPTGADFFSESKPLPSFPWEVGGGGTRVGMYAEEESLSSWLTESSSSTSIPDDPIDEVALLTTVSTSAAITIDEKTTQTWKLCIHKYVPN